jgi:hypothetical protein
MVNAFRDSMMTSPSKKKRKQNEIEGRLENYNKK